MIQSQTLTYLRWLDSGFSWQRPLFSVLTSYEILVARRGTEIGCSKSSFTFSFPITISPLFTSWWGEAWPGITFSHCRRLSSDFPLTRPSASQITEVRFNPNISLLLKSVPHPDRVSEFHRSTFPITILYRVLIFKINRETFVQWSLLVIFNCLKIPKRRECVFNNYNLVYVPKVS